MALLGDEHACAHRLHQDNKINDVTTKALSYYNTHKARCWEQYRSATRFVRVKHVVAIVAAVVVGGILASLLLVLVSVSVLLVGGYVAGSSQCDRTTARWLRGRARLSTVSALQWQQTSHESDSESAAESARVREQLVVRCIPFHVLSSHRHLRCGYHDHHHHHHCLRSSCCCCSIDGRGLGHCVGRETSCQRSPCRSCAAPSTTSSASHPRALARRVPMPHRRCCQKTSPCCTLPAWLRCPHVAPEQQQATNIARHAEYTRRGGRVGRRQTDIPLRRSFPCRIARWNSQNQNPRVAAWAQRQHRR